MTLDEGAETVLHRQRSPDGSLRVVLVRLGDAEHREHRVSDELLARASKSLDLGVDQLEELSLELAHFLRVQSLPEGSRACEVGEEDGDDAPFLAFVGRVSGAARVLPQGDPAGRAEGGARRLLGPAARAGPLKRRAARAAEASAGWMRGSAGGTGQSHAPSLRRESSLLARGATSLAIPF